MAWQKRINSKAWEPASITTITPGAGAVANVSIVFADFTVIEEYFCAFNLTVNFDQTTATTTDLSFTLPIPIRASGRWCLGSGYLAGAVGLPNVLYVREGATTASGKAELSGALAIGTGYRLVVQGHYPIR